MFKQLKLVASLAITATLVACGGGGDSGPAAPVVSTESYQFRNVYVNYITTSQTKQYTISGTSSGVAVTGTGVVTFGNVSPANFEGRAVLSRSVTATGSLVVNGQSVPLNTTSTAYFDSNYNPVGGVSTEYEVINSTPPSIPQTVKIGDTGILYTFNRYPTSTKAFSLGTNTVSYVIEPDTATTALVTIIGTEKDTSGKLTSSSSAVFRATASGNITLVKETSTDYTSNTTLTATYQ
jgi:hypothetical protein